MSWKNEIAEELYRVKDEYAANFGYDLRRMVHDLQMKEELQKREGRQFVAFPPRRCQTGFPFTPIEDKSSSLSPAIGGFPIASKKPNLGTVVPEDRNPTLGLASSAFHFW
jgi:hypothetical protein